MHKSSRRSFFLSRPGRPVFLYEKPSTCNSAGRNNNTAPFQPRPNSQELVQKNKPMDTRRWTHARPAETSQVAVLLHAGSVAMRPGPKRLASSQQPILSRSCTKRFSPIRVSLGLSRHTNCIFISAVIACSWSARCGGIALHALSCASFVLLALLTLKRGSFLPGTLLLHAQRWSC